MFGDKNSQDDLRRPGDSETLEAVGYEDADADDEELERGALKQEEAEHMSGGDGNGL